MTLIVEMKFGSSLYGTATPASDLDLKRVHLPAADDILLQRVRGVISTKTKDDPRAKNTADDVDIESFGFQRYLGLLAEGQTVALDMLFAPDWALTQPPHPLWRAVQDNRHRLISGRSAAFVGYCRAQANKYGIRGSRVAAARKALEALTYFEAEIGGLRKLGECSGTVMVMSETTEHMAVVNIPSQAGTDVLHWEVCDRKMPFTASIKSAREIMERVVAEYGHRALAAEFNQGVDWKALSHAVRIAEQAIELFQTGNITFPRPNADHLLAIKTGRLAYKEVGEQIDRLLIEVEDAAAKTLLRAQPDVAVIDGLVKEAHLGVIVRSLGPGYG